MPFSCFLHALLSSEMLVIDEVHNILAGTYREQRIVLNTLRFLSNRLQMSLVCFGVNDAREAIGGDVQLARRFEQLTLSRWAANEQFAGRLDPSQYAAASILGLNAEVSATHAADHGRHHREHIPNDQ